MNWIKRKILERVFEGEGCRRLSDFVKHGEMRGERMIFDNQNLINKKHAHLEEQIKTLDSMLQMLASEAGLEFVQVEEEPEHLELKEIEYEEGE